MPLFQLGFDLTTFQSLKTERPIVQNLLLNYLSGRRKMGKNDLITISRHDRIFLFFLIFKNILSTTTVPPSCFPLAHETDKLNSQVKVDDIQNKNKKPPKANFTPCVLSLSVNQLFCQVNFICVSVDFSSHSTVTVKTS